MEELAFRLFMLSSKSGSAPGDVTRMLAIYWWLDSGEGKGKASGRFEFCLLHAYTAVEASVSASVTRRRNLMATHEAIRARSLPASDHALHRRWTQQTNPLQTGRGALIRSSGKYKNMHS